jgi:hypothetical protein
MNKSSISHCFLVAALFLSFTSSLLGQSVPKPVQQTAEPAKKAKSKIPELSIFIAADYYGPKLNEINDEYRAIEKIYSLPAGNDFKNYYFALVGVRFTPENSQGQSVQGEFGGSILKSGKDNSTNFLRLYYTGASYILSIPVSAVSVYGGCGLGYFWLNTQRTYSSNLGVATVNAQLAELHGIFGIEYFQPSGVSFAFEGRYNYAATIAPQRADLDFTLKGMTAGIRVGIPLLMIY